MKETNRTKFLEKNKKIRVNLEKDLRELEEKRDSCVNLLKLLKEVREGNLTLVDTDSDVPENEVEADVAETLALVLRLIISAENMLAMLLVADTALLDENLSKREYRKLIRRINKNTKKFDKANLK